MQHFFRLAKTSETGVRCDENGLWIGQTPLLERPITGDRTAGWRPRPLGALNRDLTALYDLEIDTASKLSGLRAVARALDRGDLPHAQIVALFLRIPDPPSLTKSWNSGVPREAIELAQDLRASGMLKINWDASKHPRWPAGTAGGVGGEFAPGDGNGGSAHIIPGQITIPFPGEIPEVTPRPAPFPSEVLPPPIAIPNVMPRNPYPDRAGCAKEWADAEKYCSRLEERGLLGKGDYRGHGKTFAECVLGQVSERCGGYQVRADS